MNATLHPTRFLRLALLGDAAASGATGLLLAAAAGPLGPLLGLPEPLLRVAGLVLLPYALVVGRIGMRAPVSRDAMRAVVAINLVWVADSLLLLALGPWLAGLAPTGLGVAFVLFQAMVVLGFAVAQGLALRRAAGGDPAPAFA